jgi:outer membrane cobalamin receptor
MSRLWSIAVLCIMFCLPGLSLAEEEKKDKKPLATMDEVVVTATKTEEKRSDVPNSVIVMDEYDIQESPAQNLGEFLANELGIDWRTYGNYGGATQEIHIRGMSGDGTQVFVNGVNINSPSLGMANVGAIPLNNIERIEVVKGAGSLLYGSGAMGGTVNIITKSPEKDVTDFAATAGYGTNNAYQVSAEQGMYVTEQFGYYLTANRYETDGFRNNSDLVHHDMSIKFIWDNEDALQVSLYGDYIDREYGLPGVKPPEGTQDFSVDGTRLVNGESASLVNRGADNDGHAVLNITGRPNDWLIIKFKQDYSDMESYNLNRNAVGWFPALPGEGEKTWITNQAAVTEASINMSPVTSANILIGGEYRDYDYERKQIELDANGHDESGTESAENYHVFSRGTFIEGQYRPNDYFGVLVGGRYEEHSTFGHEILPRYGLIVHPAKNTVVKLSHGKHFKAPTMNDLYWPEDDWVRGNPDLKPEKGWHTDGTIEQGFLNDGIFISGSYFIWDIKDRIAWAENPNYVNPWMILKYTPTNLDTFKGEGWEIGSKVGPFYNTTVSLSFTSLDAIEEKLGGARRHATYTPKKQFKGDLTYWFDFGLTAKTTVRYVSKRPAAYDDDQTVEPSFVLDSYWTVDANLDYGIGDHWSVSLTSTNLLDEEYDTYSSQFMDPNTLETIRATYPGAGRSTFLSATYKF